MAVLYKLQQDNRDTSQHKGEWYARAKMLDIIELDELAQLIQDNTTAKKADAQAVLTEMVEQMRALLKRSYAVRIPGLGIFKVGLKTSPAATAQEFTAAKNVKGGEVGRGLNSICWRNRQSPPGLPLLGGGNKPLPLGGVFLFLICFGGTFLPFRVRYAQKSFKS